MDAVAQGLAVVGRPVFITLMDKEIGTPMIPAVLHGMFFCEIVSARAQLVDQVEGRVSLLISKPLVIRSQ